MLFFREHNCGKDSKSLVKRAKAAFLIGFLSISGVFFNDNAYVFHMYNCVYLEFFH